ncbi:MAG: RIO1 family regulatory kinase/ATPase, partial [Candidatus Bathyarchaeia archaeon]
MIPSLLSTLMSAADIAVQAFRRLEPPDFRVLLAIELAMKRHEYVPEKNIPKLANMSFEETDYRLSNLSKMGLIRRWRGPYIGYILNTAGYDCLAINAHVKANILQAFGKPLGVGKEADVYDALTPEGKRVAVKFHRLGRTSFRQTRRVRGYVAELPHVSWLYQSRLAAEREFEALKLVYPCGVSVPEPINQNRHVIVMGMIEGVELYRCPEIQKPKEVLDEIL